MQADPSLKELLATIALERHLSLAHDTHYDAKNWELSWWQGPVWHSIDVQPNPDGRLEVSHIRTSYPLLPRLLAWARRSVPMFPATSKSKHQFLGSLQWPCPPDQLRQLIDPALPPNNSFKPNRHQGGA